MKTLNLICISCFTFAGQDVSHSNNSSMFSYQKVDLCRDSIRDNFNYVANNIKKKFYFIYNKLMKYYELIKKSWSKKMPDSKGPVYVHKKPPRTMKVFVNEKPPGTMQVFNLERQFYNRPYYARTN